MIKANQRAKESQRNFKVDQNSFTSFLADGNIDPYFMERLSRISAKHRELVYETLDEFQRNKNMNFTCIFPSAGCYQYDKFFEGGGRQSNQLIHKYLFTKNELYALTKQISDLLKQQLKSKEIEIESNDRGNLSNEEEVQPEEEQQSDASPNSKKLELQISQEKRSGPSDDESSKSPEMRRLIIMPNLKSLNVASEGSSTYSPTKINGTTENLAEVDEIEELAASPTRPKEIKENMSSIYSPKSNTTQNRLSIEGSGIH